MLSVPGAKRTPWREEANSSSSRESTCGDVRVRGHNHASHLVAFCKPKAGTFDGAGRRLQYRLAQDCRLPC